MLNKNILAALLMMFVFANHAKAADTPPNEAPFVDSEAPNEQNSSNVDEAEKKSDVTSSTEVGPTKEAPHGSKYIRHPWAAKGLTQIRADGTYVYKTDKKTIRSQSSTIRFGSIQPPNIEGPPYSTGGHDTFESMYTENNIPSVQFDYEWQPFTSFGKLGVQAGFGLFTSTGAGHFSDGTVAQETYNFYALPLSLGGIYRLELTRRQWLAPYVSGGVSYYPLIELRDDGNRTNLTGTFAGYGAGGLMFNVSAWDKDVAYQLDSEYGISNLWISLEFKAIKGFNQDLDVSANCLSLGFGVDY